MQLGIQQYIDTTAWEQEFIFAQNERFDAAFATHFDSRLNGTFPGRFAASLSEQLPPLFGALFGQLFTSAFGVSFDSAFGSAFMPAFTAAYQTATQQLLATILPPMLAEFKVESYAVAGATDDTDAIQAAVDAATTYYLLNPKAGAIVSFQLRPYFVTRTIRVRADGIMLMGVACGRDTWGPLGTWIVPSPDFASDTYVIAFDPTDNGHSLQGNRLQGISIVADPATPFVNTVHGILWGVADGVMLDVHVQGMSGRGLGIKGHSTEYKAIDNRFIHSHFRKCGTHGIEYLGSASDNWWWMVKSEGNVNGSGLHGMGANDYFGFCHFTGNLNNIRNTTGSTETRFGFTNFETPRQHNILLDTTGGGVSRAAFGFCNINSNALTAHNTYDSIHMSGNSPCSGVVSNCSFPASGTANKPRHHVYLGNAAYHFNVNNNVISPNSAATSSIGYSTQSTRCLVNGVGRNGNFDPRTGGAWMGYGEEGLTVVKQDTNTLYMHANGDWRPLN